MQKVSLQFQVSRSFVKLFPMLWSFDLFLDTRQQLSNTMQTNRFLMHQLVCICGVQHENKQFHDNRGTNFRPARVTIGFVLVIYLRETCPPSRFSILFICVIRCGFFSSHILPLRNNEKLNLRSALSSFLILFVFLPLDKSLFLLVGAIYRAITLQRNNEPWKDVQRLKDNIKFCITNADHRNLFNITAKRFQPIKLTSLLGKVEIAFAIIEINFNEDYVKIAAHQVIVHHDSMHHSRRWFRKLILHGYNQMRAYVWSNQMRTCRN